MRNDVLFFVTFGTTIQSKLDIKPRSRRDLDRGEIGLPWQRSVPLSQWGEREKKKVVAKVLPFPPFQQVRVSGCTES